MKGTAKTSLMLFMALTSRIHSQEFDSKGKNFEYGGERGIRTLDGLLTHTPLAGERLRPLGHLSGGSDSNTPHADAQGAR